jgi:hypothetical protein
MARSADLTIVADVCRGLPGAVEDALLTLRDLIVSTFDTRLGLKEPQPKQEADEHDELL